MAALARWQDAYREETKASLREAGVEAKYIEDDSEEEELDDDDEPISETKEERVAGDAASGRMDLGN